MRYLLEIEEFLSPLRLGKKAFDGKQRLSLYRLAMSIFRAGRYAEAAEYFIQLILHDPHEPKYWKGLAASHQKNRAYEEALRAWSIVCLLDNHPPEAHYHAAKCYLAMGNLEEAKKAITMAKQTGEAHGRSA